MLSVEMQKIVCELQGIRGAVPQDLAAIQGLLQPLEARGVLAPRTDAQLLTDLRHFRVAERDAKVCLQLLRVSINTTKLVNNTQSHVMSTTRAHPE